MTIDSQKMVTTNSQAVSSSIGKNLDDFIDQTNTVLESHESKISDIYNKISEMEAKVSQGSSDAGNKEGQDEEAQDDDNNYVLYKGKIIYVVNTLEGKTKDLAVKGKTLFKKDNLYTEEFVSGSSMKSLGEETVGNDGKYLIIFKSNKKNLFDSGEGYENIKNIYGAKHPYVSDDGVNIKVGGNNRFICLNVTLTANTTYTLSCDISNMSGTVFPSFYYIFNGADDYSSSRVAATSNKLAYKFTTKSSGLYYLRFYYGGAAAETDNCLLSDFQLEVGTTNTEHEEYFESSSIISLDSPLRAIGNVADEFIDGKVIRRIGIRKYTNGDENLTGVLTDKTNTLYKLNVETTTKYGDVKIDTFNGNTTISLMDNVANEFSLKVPVNIVQSLNLASDTSVTEEIKNMVVDMQNDNASIKSRLTKIEERLNNMSKVTISGVEYNSPLLLGARGDGVSEDSRYFTNGYNYLDKDKTFLISKEKAKYLQNSLGNGWVTIKDFPLQPQPSRKQGNFNIKDINDELIMDMNLPNEAVPHGTQERAKISGWFPFDDISMPSGYHIINPWGQVYIREDKIYPDNTVVYIKNLALIVYKKSTKSWSIINQINNINGGFYLENYKNETIVRKPITKYGDKISVNITSETAGRCFHFWTNQVWINDPSDILNVAVYVDAWAEGSDVDDKFVFNVGADYRQGYDTKTHEVIGGRFKRLRTFSRRTYATNLTYDKYFSICNQQLIDNLK